MQEIIIGSRGSDLALWQANFVKGELEKLGAKVHIKIIKTQGDKIQHLSFDKMEGKGFFTKEIETALLEKSIDLAVHSHKDLETKQPKGLKIGAVSSRGNPADVLLIAKNAVDAKEKWGLKKAAVVGTSSARRKSQLMRFRKDVVLKDLRGNVPTRIQKLREGNYDAIVLAKAGVERLQISLEEFHAVELNPKEFVPAPAQGVLALQVREEDAQSTQLVAQLNDAAVAKRIRVERKVLKLLNGGCQLPLGVYCDTSHKTFVSYSSDWRSGANWSEYSNEELDDLPATIVENLTKNNHQ